LPGPLGRLRRAAVPLITLAVAIPVLGVPTASSAADGPVASFDYSMPDRFGLDENGDGLTDYVAGTSDSPGPVQVDPSSWHVDLDACGSTDGAELTWRVVEQLGQRPLTHLEVGGLDVPELRIRVGRAVEEEHPESAVLDPAQVRNQPGERHGGDVDSSDRWASCSETPSRL
jgi:hypothetical protein